MRFFESKTENRVALEMRSQPRFCLKALYWKIWRIEFFNCTLQRKNMRLNIQCSCRTTNNLWVYEQNIGIKSTVASDQPWCTPSGELKLLSNRRKERNHCIMLHTENMVFKSQGILQRKWYRPTRLARCHFIARRSALCGKLKVSYCVCGTITTVHTLLHKMLLYFY